MGKLTRWVLYLLQSLQTQYLLCGYSRKFPKECRARTEYSGKANIICTVNSDGTPQEFDAKIVSVNKIRTSRTKSFVIEVTDERLLEKTGGIIQGMSGSPLIQNGKLIGAVTHVFINDPTRGYGIFIENMLAEAEKIK